MDGDVPQAPITQEAQPETKGLPQTPPPIIPPKPKKRLKTKILIILLVLIGLSAGGFFVWKNFFAPREIYKGVWMPSLGASMIPESILPEGVIPEGYDISIMEPVFADLDKAAEAGINTLAFQMGYWVDDQGELSMIPGEEEFFASFIEEAHSRGFKIWLNPEIIYFREVEGASEMRIMPEELIENTDLIENFKDGIIEIAKFAEEHDVEIFSPSSEMFVNIGRERSKEVIIDIKPEIDAVYKGKICLKAEWPIQEFLPHYSCFGPPANIPRNEQEKIDLINHLEQEREKNVELIIGEMWEGNDWYGSQEEALRGFEMALEAIKGKVNGVFILDTGRDYIQLFPESFESTIKEFYSGLEEDLKK